MDGFIISFIPVCVVFAFLIIFIAFQISKKHRRQQFIVILKSSKLLLVILVFTAIIISVLFYHFLGTRSIPIISVTMLFSLILPVLISVLRYSLDKK